MFAKEQLKTPLMPAPSCTASSSPMCSPSRAGSSGSLSGLFPHLLHDAMAKAILQAWGTAGWTAGPLQGCHNRSGNSLRQGSTFWSRGITAARELALACGRRAELWSGKCCRGEMEGKNPGALGEKSESSAAGSKGTWNRSTARKKTLSLSVSRQQAHCHQQRGPLQVSLELQGSHSHPCKMPLALGCWELRHRGAGSCTISMRGAASPVLLTLSLCSLPWNPSLWQHLSTQPGQCRALHHCFCSCRLGMTRSQLLLGAGRALGQLGVTG